MTEPTYANPVWHKGWRIYLSDMMFAGYQYVYQHDDFDPTPNEPGGPAGDNRQGYAKSIDDAKFEIDAEWFPEDAVYDGCGPDCVGALCPECGIG